MPLDDPSESLGTPVLATFATRARESDRRKGKLRVGILWKMMLFATFATLKLRVRTRARGTDRPIGDLGPPGAEMPESTTPANQISRTPIFLWFWL